MKKEEEVMMNGIEGLICFEMRRDLVEMYYKYVCK